MKLATYVRITIAMAIRHLFKDGRCIGLFAFKDDQIQDCVGRCVHDLGILFNVGAVWIEVSDQAGFERIGPITPGAFAHSFAFF